MVNGSFREVMQLENKQLAIVCLTLVLCSVIVSLPFWYNPVMVDVDINQNQYCCPCYPGTKKLTKIWKWEHKNGKTVENEITGDKLAMWLEKDGVNVTGSLVTFNNIGDEWKHTWHNLHDATYKVCYVYKHSEADPSEDQGCEEVEVNCHVTKTNILGKPEPKG